MSTNLDRSPIKEVITASQLSSDMLEQQTSGRCVLTSVVLNDVGLMYEHQERKGYVLSESQPRRFLGMV